MLHGIAASATKLLDFQSKSPPPLVVDSGMVTSTEPRREYIIDDADLVGAVRTWCYDLVSLFLDALVLIVSVGRTRASEPEWSTCDATHHAQGVSQ
jgi:hypothetical protein